MPLLPLGPAPAVPLPLLAVCSLPAAARPALCRLPAAARAVGRLPSLAPPTILCRDSDRISLLVFLLMPLLASAVQLDFLLAFFRLVLLRTVVVSVGIFFLFFLGLLFCSLRACLLRASPFVGFGFRLRSQHNFLGWERSFLLPLPACPLRAPPGPLQAVTGPAVFEHVPEHLRMHFHCLLQAFLLLLRESSPRGKVLSD